MSSRNDITGDKQATKSATDAYRDGWDRIFGKKNVPKKKPDAKLWEKARKLYQASASNDPAVHCNRFPAWEELSDEQQQGWIEEAKK
jgi:hypothetical protein